MLSGATKQLNCFSSHLVIIFSDLYYSGGRSLIKNSEVKFPALYFGWLIGRNCSSIEFFQVVPAKIVALHHLVSVFSGKTKNTKQLFPFYFTLVSNPYLSSPFRSSVK